MIKFFKHHSGDVPEILNLKTKLRSLQGKEETQGLNLVQVSDELTKTEEVVVVRDIETAIEVNSEHPTARILLSVEDPFSIKPTEISKLHNYGISALYLRNDLESGVRELTEAFEKKKDMAFTVRQEPVIATLNEQGLLQVAGFQNEELIGQSPAIREMLQVLAVLKDYNVDVLVLGEAGVGKTNIVKAFAANAKQDYYGLNITELSEELFQSQLFGYKKGAFTGAMADTKGVLEQYSKGMVFFDEMGDLSKANQVKLLTVLQSRNFRPVGESKNNIDFKGRFVFATNRDMEELVEKGEMRQDFLSRLRRFVLKVPSLQERREDISLLTQHFIQRYNKEYKKNTEITVSSLDLLGQLRWRENVRQLENLISPIVLLESSRTITPEVLIKHMRGRNDPNLVDNKELFLQPINVGKVEPKVLKEESVGFFIDKENKPNLFYGELFLDSRVEDQKIKLASGKGLDISVYNNNELAPSNVLHNVTSVTWNAIVDDMPFVVFESSHNNGKIRVPLSTIGAFSSTVADKIETQFIERLEKGKDSGIAEQPSEKIVFVKSTPPVLIQTIGETPTLLDHRKEQAISFDSPMGVSISVVGLGHEDIINYHNVTKISVATQGTSSSKDVFLFESAHHGNMAAELVSGVSAFIGASASRYEKTFVQSEQVHAEVGWDKAKQIFLEVEARQKEIDSPKPSQSRQASVKAQVEVEGGVAIS